MIDVLVIGSGGAGLSAALHAKYSGCNVTVLSKTYPTHSQTSQAQAGINAVMSNEHDSIESHINDTLKSAHGIGEISNINNLCQNAKENVEWLDDIAVPFSRDNNNQIAQRQMDN